MPSEVQARAEFSAIRYAQVWEDADVLLAGLDIQPGDTCVAIASAGDNALAMLTRDPARVVAVDLNPAQIACLELRVAAYRELEHGELLELMGSRPSERRAQLYARCRRHLGPEARARWDGLGAVIQAGIGGGGKFERYFRLFRERVLPLVHGGRDVRALLRGGDPERRRAFYRNRWDTWRWRLLFRIFFSRFVMGRMGRDPEFFRYVRGSVADRILERTRHALTELDPAGNPYLHWILRGTHGDALPLALRAESFGKIRANLDRLEWRLAPLEDVLDNLGPRSVDRFNLSDIFEYMSPEAYQALLARLALAGRPGARLAYWNMLAPRRRPEAMAERLRPLEEQAGRLFREDKAWFYSDFVLEEVLP
jgi:S-adenosylmethionine-diacylglycerol 3-amino-3-carboxypropyl transferase